MKVVAITGVSRGLGAALLAESNGRFDHALALGRGLAPAGDSPGELPVVPVEIDLSIPDAASRLNLQSVQPLAKCEHLTLVLNAAVIEPLGRAGDISSDDFQSALRVNFSSGVELVTAFYKASVQLGFGLHVVNISSGAAKRPIGGWSSYCSTKVAMMMWLDCFALDHEEVAVEHVDPGILDTGMQSQIREYGDDENIPAAAGLREAYEDGKLQDPAVVAREILERATSR